MGAEARCLINGKKTPAPALPPALYVVRSRSRAGRVVDLDDGAGTSTPSLRTPVTVPFLWEDAPGRPKQHGDTVPGAPTSTAKVVVPADGDADRGDQDQDGDGDATARPLPLKLPPRLQVPSSAAEHSLSPKTVLQGPYGCTRRPPRTALGRSGSVASFRRTPSAGAGFFSRRKAAAATWIDRKSGRERHNADASCSSPSASSSSSSSSSVSFFGDDRGHGTHRLPADQEEEEEEEEGAKASVRITRFTRNRSLPSMTTSHLWRTLELSVCPNSCLVPRRKKIILRVLNNCMDSKHPQKRQADCSVELDEDRQGTRTMAHRRLKRQRNCKL
ncbi:hypothetical protein EJB05_15922, partial [Eragrostis curvula]